MPTYDFRCPGGHEFERFFRKISDAPKEHACPECGQTATRLVSGGAGLLFKGSGFYLTDYGKNAHRGESSKAGKTGEGGGESKGSEKKPGEAKPAESKPAEPRPSSPGTEGKPAKPTKSSGTGDA